MNKLQTLSFRLLFAFFILGTLPAHAGQPSSTVREEFVSAWNSKDIKALGALYEEKAVLTVNGKNIDGRANIQKHFSEVVEPASKIEMTSAKNEDSKGGGVHDSGSFQYNVPTGSVKLGSNVRLGEGVKIGGGGARQINGIYSFTAKREKEKWLIFEQTWSEGK